MTDSSQLEKLQFTIYDCTSRDDNYHERTLEYIHSSNGSYNNNTTKGWLTAPNCAYPQQVVLQFQPQQYTFHIRKIQILSHQCKIASSIEIHIGDAAQQYTRLGYMSLDSNQRSEYKARELKSVYINSRGNFLKLLIKNCHQNNLNPYNQVGIVAINVMGSVVPSNNMQPLYNSIEPVYNSQVLQQQQYTPHAQQPQQQFTQHTAPMHQSFTTTMQQADSRNSSGNLTGLDPATAKKLNELELAKQHAIDSEDYDEAKRLKVLIDGVKRVAMQFAELEKQKQAAVASEDYDLAKQIKKQIDSLRSQALNSSTNVVQQQQQYSPHRIHSAQLSPHMQSSASTASLHSQQSVFSAPVIDDDRPIKPLNQNKQPTYGSGNTSNRAPLHAQAVAEYGEADEEKISTVSYNAPVRRADINDDRPLHKGAAANTQFTDDAKTDAAEDDGTDSGVAEALSAGNRKDAEQLIEIYGEPVCEQLYSKQWTYRVQALKHISDEVANNVQNAHLHADDKTLFATLIKILKRTINDNIAQVCLAAMHLLEVGMIAVSSSIKPDELRMQLDSVVLLLIDKLSDANVRVRDSALNSLIILAQNKLHGLSLIPTHLLAPLKKKETDKPLPLKSRARLLQKLLQRYQINEKANLSVQSIMLWLIPYLQHRDVNVRDAMMNLAAVLANLVGTNKLEPFFKDIRSSTLDTLMQRIDDVNTGKVTFSPIEPNRTIQQTDNAAQPRSQASSRQNNLHVQQQAQPATVSPREFHINSHNNTEYEDNVRTNLDFGTAGVPALHPPAQDNTSDNESHNELAEHLAETSIGDDSPDLTGKCQFCGLEDPSFTEERLDLHYWQDCPMLTSCKQCEQVIEIATLDEHLLHECEVTGLYEQCAKCRQPIPTEQYAQHTNGNCSAPVPGTTRCPLCTIQLPNTDDGWKMHLLTQGCTKNTRAPQLR